LIPHRPWEAAVPLESFAKYPLLFGPSPVHRLDRLNRHLGGAPIWAKREDCNSGIAYGGNKTRKLKYLVADALAQGCDTLVDLVTRGEIEPTATVLYAHLGGQPALNGYSALFS
jgi:1-aminocyclopropane-1-carboxylate deaminase/D-cysteine desulfhydrase-like pyridoxal-dependent ACC family enzyme